jgi:hypothetical protein
MTAVKDTVDQVAGLEKYEHGFVTDIEQEFAPRGLNRDTVAFISAKKDEPAWMLDWRLDAYRRWLTMRERSRGATVPSSWISAPSRQTRMGSFCPACMTVDT